MKKRTRPQRNIWKTVSVIFILLFVSIIAWGLLSLGSRPVFAELTEEQITLARDIVAEDLESSGDSIDNYEVSVTKRMIGFVGRGHHLNGGPYWKPVGTDKAPCNMRGGVQVSLRNNYSGHLYIVDTQSRRVLMRSFTEWPDA